MKVLLLLIALLTSFSVYACYGRLVDQYPAASVTEKICVYEHRFDTVTRVVSASSPCPSSVYVEH